MDQGNEELSAGRQEKRVGRFNGALTRLVLPLLKAVRRPYHLYPIGILFGLGFDTASSITLLSVAAIAQRDGPEMNSNHGNGRVVLLAFLFTAGMTAVDSCDSVIMMFAYSRLGREDALRSEARTTEKVKADVRVETIPASNVEDEPSQEIESKNVRPADVDEEARESLPGPAEPKIYQGAAPMISFYLTLLSVLLAFSICIIEVFSIVAEQCKSCAAAASVEPPSERSLRGRWWAFWSAASDQLGYIGAGIVGVFVLITLSWWIGRRLYAWRVRKSNGAGQDEDTRFTLKARLKRTLTLCSTGVRLRQSKPRRGLTLLGGSVALIGAEILANAAMWTITAVVFITSHRRSDLALAVLAWTTGLRHGLDADHISAIDNSIRRFLALERQDALSAQLQQLPVVELQNGDSARPTKTSWRQAFWRGFNSPILTGLFFSLGHSTIVIIATVVIAITTSALSGLEAFGDGPGGYVGTIATFANLTAMVNCPNDETSVQCLRQIDQVILANASAIIAQNYSSNPYLGYWPWTPVQDAAVDGFWFREQPSKLVNKGQYAVVPMITGDCADEGTIFAAHDLENATSFDQWFRHIAVADVSTDPDQQSRVTGLLQRLYELVPDDVTQGSPYFNPPNAVSKGVTNVSDPIFQPATNQYKRAARMFSTWRYEAPRRKFLRLFANQTKSGAWTYRFHQHDNSNAIVGTSHGSEIVYILGNTSTINSTGLYPPLSKLMQRAWISFANFNDPTALGHLDWPRYSEEERSMIQFKGLNVTLIRDDYQEGALAYMRSDEMSAILSS
ncbi:unnamed protein product [Tilletia controversa]|nr:unnamed protein product [Tilletia controversa]